MDAQSVWLAWRAILRSDELVDAVLNPRQHETPATTTGDSNLSAVLESYAADRLAADFTISMYRRGLVRNALSALLLAPMSRRLLYASRLDVGELTEAYVKLIGYRDDGPNFWSAAASFVAFLGTLPEFASLPRQDAIMFESAVIAHMRALGERPPLVWPRSAATNAAATGGAQRYVANSACTVHTSHCDLTPWLEDPTEFDVELEPGHGTRHWLISVPDSESSHTCAELSARAARAFTLLSAPKNATELADALGQSSGDTLDILEALLGTAAILRAPPAARGDRLNHEE